MKKTYITVGVATVLALCAQVLWAKAVYDGTARIEISGKGNTLSSVAKDIGDPGVFSYDGGTRTAACRAVHVTVVNGGELTIGVKGQKDKGETLILECKVAPGLTKDKITQDKEKYGFSVREGGSLNIYHSKVNANNGLINASTARHSGIAYGSLSSGQIVDAELRKMKCLQARHNQLLEVDGLLIEDCVMGVYLHSANALIKRLETKNVTRAAFVRGREDRKVRFVSCSLSRRYGEAILCSRTDRGKKPVVIDFVDCSLPDDPAKRVSIRGDRGNIGIRVLHAVKLRLLDANNAPLSGTRVELVSNSDGAPEVVSAVTVTDDDGNTWFTVPEYVDYVGDIAASPTPKHIRYANRLAISDGSVLKQSWAPGEKSALVFTRTTDGFSESKAAFTAGKAVSIRNLVNNSSFEITSYPGVPDCWWPRTWKQFTEDGRGRCKPGDPLTFLGIDRKNPYHGKQCLRIGPNIARGIWRLPAMSSGGKTFTASAYMRSDTPGTKAKIGFGRGGVEEPIFELTSEWKRYHFTAFVPRAYILCLLSLGPGDACIDAIQLEEGDTLHPYVGDNYRPFVY